MAIWLRALAAVGLTAGLAGSVAWASGGHAVLLAGVPATVWIACLAFAINGIAWVPAAIWRTERFFDAVGALTFLSVVGAAVAVGPGVGRGWLLAGAVAVWALRLGSFLLRRVMADGRDGRFDSLKQHPGRFLVPWTLQALWATAVALPVVVVATDARAPALGWVDGVGLALWALGFALEVVADGQKSAFRAKFGNRGRFIQHGLWAWSRHPNYFGEILLWTGLCVAASGSFTGGQWVAWVSPLLTALLLTRVSGIPLLEARAEERWGEEPGYREYVANTPVLVLWPPRR